MNQIKKNNIAYGKLLNKCWEDPAYLEKFRADPAAALREFGIPTPPNARYHIVDPKDMKPSTNEDVYLFYMDKPEVTSLSDSTLNQVAGGDAAADTEADYLVSLTNVIAHLEAVTELAAAVDVAAVVIVVIALAGSSPDTQFQPNDN